MEILRIAKNIVLGIVDFVVSYWKIVIPLIAIIIIVVFIQRACKAHSARLNEKQIVAAQQAIAKQDREEMTKVLVESDVQEKQIDQNVADAEVQKVAAIAESKKKAEAMTNDELAAELERRSKE